jgi:hypothetical protein
VEELAERDWDDSPYEVRIKKLAANGIPSKKLDLSNCQPMGSKFSIVFNDGWRNIFFALKDMEAFAVAKGFKEKSKRFFPVFTW